MTFLTHLVSCVLDRYIASTACVCSRLLPGVARSTPQQHPHRLNWAADTELGISGRIPLGFPLFVLPHGFELDYVDYDATASAGLFSSVTAVFQTIIKENRNTSIATGSISEHNSYARTLF